MNITHYMIKESSTQPAAGDPGWVAVTPSSALSITGGSFVLSAGEGVKHVYAWVKDDAGNVSALNSSSHFDLLVDKTAPLVTSFTLTSPSPTIAASATFNLTATDAVGITGWMVTRSGVKPGAGDPGWNAVSSTTSLSLVGGTYTLVHAGTNTLYAWTKDAAGNVSDKNSSSYFDVIYQKNPWDDVLLRDYLSDDGTIPTSGTLCFSPDLICNRNVTVTNPALSFPDYMVDYYKNPYVSHENYFYVRAKNMGTGLTDEQAQTYIYYTNASLLMNPADWITHPMKANPGTGDQNNNPLPAAPGGSVVFAKYPFKWTPAPLPSGQHYCIIGVCSTPNHPWDPANPPRITSVSDFIVWVQYNPNVCWHNISLEELPAGGGGSGSGFRGFGRDDKFNNPWKEDLAVLVEVQVRDVPVGAKVTIRNKELGIDVTRVVEKKDEVILAPGAVLPGKTKTAVQTAIEAPADAKWVHGAKLQVSAYVGTRSKNFKKLGLTTDFGKNAMEVPEIRKAAILTEKLGTNIDVKAEVAMPKLTGRQITEKPVKIKETDMADAPVNFVRLGTCTTIVVNPAKKALPVMKGDRLFPEIVLEKKPPKKGIPLEKDTPAAKKTSPVLKAGVGRKKDVLISKKSDPSAREQAKGKSKKSSSKKPQTKNVKPEAAKKTEAKAGSVTKKKTAVTRKGVIAASKSSKTPTLKRAVLKEGSKSAKKQTEKALRKPVIKKLTVKGKASGTIHKSPGVKSSPRHTENKKKTAASKKPAKTKAPVKKKKIDKPEKKQPGKKK